MALRDALPALTPTHSPVACPSVMVVEDDETLRALLAHYLRGEGYAVEEIADGAAALRALDERRAAGDPPGVVLLDLMLPHVSGLSVLERLAAESADVPVVAMSVYDPLLLAASAAGAHSLLFKPFDLEQLLPVVAQYCETPPAGTTAPQ